MIRDDQIVAALDAAFASHVAKLFDVMMVSEASGVSGALDRFSQGLKIAVSTYDRARDRVETIRSMK